MASKKQSGASSSAPSSGAAPEGGSRAPVTFLTVAEVAAMMRVSKMTVYRMVHAGDLPAVRVGRSFRVPEKAVHDYLRPPTSKPADACSIPRWARVPAP